MASIEEARDEWDVHDEVEMSRSSELDSSNFFASEDGENKDD
jgi:hypothetical protein